MLCETAPWLLSGTTHLLFYGMSIKDKDFVKVYMAKSQDSGYVDNWQSGKSVIECNLHMLTTEDCSDVIFRVGPEKDEVRAHRYVLVSRSCVFHAMFCGPLAEKGEVTIPDIETNVFREFLRYIYTDSVDVTAGTVTGLLYTSRKYAVDGLLKLCTAFLDKSLSEDNVCQILEHCHCYGELDLEQKALKILVEAGERVIKSQGFLDLCDLCLLKFLKSETLGVTEEEIFQAALNWTQEACKRQHMSPSPENLRKRLGDMIYEIRFGALSPEYLSKIVGPSGVLTSEERIRIMDRNYDFSVDISPFKSTQRKQQKADSSSKESIRYYTVSRYRTRYSNWGVKGRPEAVSFSVNKDIQLAGCQLYGPSALSESTYQVDILLYNDNDVPIARPVSTCMWLEGRSKFNDIFFPEPIQLVAGYRYSICVMMKGDLVDYGTDGLSSVCVDGVEFTFMDSRVGIKTLTSTRKGQIPGLIYTLKDSC